MRRALTAAAATAAVLLVSACGGDDAGSAAPAAVAPSAASAGPGDEATTPATSPTGTPVPKTEASARRTVRTYIDSFFGGRTAEACALMTPAFQQANITAGESMGIAADATCPEAMKQVVEFASLDFAPGDFTVGKATVQGDRATVLVAASKGLRDNTYVLSWSGSQWLLAGTDS